VKLVGEFRVSYFIAVFLAVTLPLLLFTGLAAPRPLGGGWDAWQPVLFQRLAWASAFGVITYLGAWLNWATPGESDRQLIREHLKATFAEADV
jgi:hypothetical protein